MKKTNIESLLYSPLLKAPAFPWKHKHWIASIVATAILSASPMPTVDKDPACEVFSTYSTAVGTKLQIRDCVTNIITKEIDIRDLM